MQKSYNKEDIYLTISNIKLKQVLSVKHTAEIYNTP
jgi:hypothetical protein